MNNQLKTIKLVLSKNENYFKCSHCKSEYLAFNETVKTFCAICQKEEIKEFNNNLKFTAYMNEDDDFSLFGITD